MDATDGTWHRSSRCETGTCVEVARVDGHVAVRESNKPGGPTLLVTEQAWAAFVAGIRAGEFD